MPLDFADESPTPFAQSQARGTLKRNRNPRTRTAKAPRQSSRAGPSRQIEELHSSVSSTSSELSQVDYRNPIHLMKVVCWSSMPSGCAICLGSHLTVNHPKDIKTIGDSEDPIWVTWNGAMRLKRPRTTVSMYGYWNTEGRCKFVEEKGFCVYQHECTACGDQRYQHPAIACPKYRADKLLQVVRAGRTKEKFKTRPVPAAPSILPGSVALPTFARASLANETHQPEDDTTGGLADPAAETESGGMTGAVLLTKGKPRYRPSDIIDVPHVRDFGVRDKGFQCKVWPVPGDADWVEPARLSVAYLKIKYPLPYGDTSDPMSIPDDRYHHLPMVELRPGATRWMGTAEVLAECPADCQEAIGRIFESCRTLPSQEDFEEARKRDVRVARKLNKELREAEELQISKNDAKYPAACFEIENIERFQLVDGAPSIAPVTILLHYPTAHSSKEVLTLQASSTRFVRQSGIRSSSSKPTLVSVLNSIPIKCIVDQHSTGINVAPIQGSRERHDYPSTILTVAKNHRAKLLYENVKTRDGFVVAFGRDWTSKVLERLEERLVEMPEIFSIKKFTMSRRVMRKWELGIECPQLSVLLDDSVGRRYSFPANYEIEPLFPYQRIFQDKEIDDDGAVNDEANEPVNLEFTLIERIGHDIGTLILHLPHPETAVHSYSSYHDPFLLDLGMSILRSVVTGDIPRSIDWHGCIAHANAVSRICDQVDAFERAQEGAKLATGQVRHFSKKALPREHRRLVNNVKAKAVPVGTVGSVDSNDYIARVKVALA